LPVMPEPGKAMTPIGRSWSIRSLRLNGPSVDLLFLSRLAARGAAHCRAPVAAAPAPG
jgi:hypothetical protein